MQLPDKIEYFYALKIADYLGKRDLSGPLEDML